MRYFVTVRDDVRVKFCVDVRMSKRARKGKLDSDTHQRIQEVGLGAAFLPKLRDLFFRARKRLNIECAGTKYTQSFSSIY
jgi:hypothetical protein